MAPISPSTLTLSGAEHSSAFVIYDNGFADGTYACDAGPNFDFPPVPVSEVLNNCGGRVWLHQYTNYVNHGWAYCIDPGPGTRKDIPSDRQFPANIQITTNGNACS
jgi:hypothetical protein